MEKNRRKHHFKTMKRPEIPVEYREMYDYVVNPWKFPIDEWFVSPKNDKKMNFLNWLYREGLCVEFSEGKTHFRITGSPQWGVTLSEMYGTGSSYGDFYIKAYSEEAVSNQKNIWDNKKKELISKFNLIEGSGSTLAVEHAICITSYKRELKSKENYEYDDI